MKHWLNSWEKYIGKRLGNAEATPGSHVWTRIERELDAQLVNDRNRTLRRSAGIVLLLLLLSTTLIFTGKPDAEKAMAGYFIQLEDNGPPTAWIYEQTLPLTVTDKNASVANRIIVAELVRDEAISQTDKAAKVRTAEISSDEVPFMEERYVLELAELEDEHADLEVPLQSFASAPVHAFYQTIDLDGRAGGVELNNDPEISTVRDAIHKVKTGKRELLSRIAASTSVVSPLIVRTDDPDLRVNTQIHTLVIQPTYFETEMIDVERQNLAIEHPQFTVPTTAVKALDEHSEENADANAGAAEDQARSITASEMNADAAVAPEEETAMVSPEVEVSTAVVEMENKAAWMAGALEELEQWKELMEDMNEAGKSELEELVDEAIIEEEDPLTRKNKEAMDLYRSYNVNKGFHIGLVAGYQNTWVTKETRNPEIDRSVVKSKIAPGYQAGINMGYDITDHFGLMMEIKFSDEGGRYYNPVKDRTEHLDLKYFEVPIYAKVKHSKMTEKLRPIVFNYLVGFSYSDLKKVNTIIDGNIEQRFGQDYNTTQWGLTAGFDFDLYLHKHFFWSVGARAGVSGDSKAFPKFKGEDGNSSVAFDAGIYTRFSFRMPGR